MGNALDNQLSNAVAGTKLDGAHRVEVDDADLDFTTVAGIDGPGCVDQTDAVPHGKARPRVDKRCIPGGQCDGHTGGQQGTLTRLQCGSLRGHQVKSCIARMGSLREWHRGIKPLNQDVNSIGFPVHGPTVARAAGPTAARAVSGRWHPDLVTSTNPTHYRERLTAPWWLWLASCVVCATLGIAYAAPFTATIGLVVFGISFGVVAIGLMRSAPIVEVRDGVVRAGVATMDLEFVGSVSALDADQSRKLRGPDADPFAWMTLRGWIATAVRLDVADPNDDTPYWYISTRHPAALVAAFLNQSPPKSADR